MRTCTPPPARFLVVAALDERDDPARRDRLVSLRVSLHKIVLVSGGLGGLSIGREVSTVQVGRTVLSLMAASLLASRVARMVTRPMYLELAALLVPGARAESSTALTSR